MSEQTSRASLQSQALSKNQAAHVTAVQGEREEQNIRMATLKFLQVTESDDEPYFSR